MVKKVLSKFKKIFIFQILVNFKTHLRLRKVLLIRIRLILTLKIRVMKDFKAKDFSRNSLLIRKSLHL
jgi:hypothetical protein